jgi:hypothetical protein
MPNDRLCGRQSRPLVKPGYTASVTEQPRLSPADADHPVNQLAALQAKQTALIKHGQELMRELDKVTAEIAKHQAIRDDATKRNRGSQGLSGSSGG